MTGTLALPPTSCVTLGKGLHLCVLRLPVCKLGVILTVPISQGDCEGRGVNTYKSAVLRGYGLPSICGLDSKVGTGGQRKPSSGEMQGI